MPDKPTTTSVTMPLQVRAASVAANTVNAEARTVDVVFTTGARVARFSFLDGPFQEELDTSPGAVRLGRLNAGGPVLDSHRSFGLDGVIGVVEPGTAKMGKGEGRATVRFARDDDTAERIWNKVAQGIIKAVSVGYRVHKFVETKTKDGARILRAVDWEPFEISFVAVGADAAATVRADAVELPCLIESPALAARSAEYEAARAEAITAGRESYQRYALEVMDAVRDAGGSIPDAWQFMKRRAPVTEVREALGFTTKAADAYTPGMIAERMAARFPAAAAADDDPAGAGRLAARMRDRFAH